MEVAFLTLSVYLTSAKVRAKSRFDIWSFFEHRNHYFESFQCSHKENCIDTARKIRIIANLCPLTPHNFSSCRRDSELGYVDFYDGTLGQNAKLSIQRRRRVFLHAQNRHLYCDPEGRMTKIHFLITQTHWTNKAFILYNQHQYCLS